MNNHNCALLIVNCNAVVAQLAERRLPKPQVAGSNPVYRSLPKRERGRKPLESDLFFYCKNYYSVTYNLPSTMFLSNIHFTS